jgi:drug/metabolite transporter (DMT)-like permease
MRSERFMIVVAYVLVCLIWGSTWLFIKVGLGSIPPLYGVAIRFTLAASILLAINGFRRKRIPLDRESRFLYAVMGVLSFSVPFALVYWSEQYIPSGLASVLFAVYPFVVAVLSHLMLPHEKMNAFKFLGISLGFVGILVIFWSDLHFGDADTLAMGAVVLSTILQGTSLIIVKKRGRHIDPVTLNSGGMLVGLVIMYLMAFFLEDFSAVHFDAPGIGSILYLGTFGTVVTFVAYYWLLKRAEAVYLSLTSLVTPVIALILGAIFLDEKPSGSVFWGAALVLSGILIANGREYVVRMRRAPSA